MDRQTDEGTKNVLEHNADKFRRVFLEKKPSVCSILIDLNEAKKQLRKAVCNQNFLLFSLLS